jgi:hypothetical protein
MDETQSRDETAAERSSAATLALAGIGLLGAGNRRAVRTLAQGVRVAAVVGAPVWHSPPLGPARRAGRSVLDSLVAEGGRHEVRWRAELETTVTERVVDSVTSAVVGHAIVERVAAQMIAAGTLERVAAQVTDSPLPLRLVDDVLTERVTDPIVARVVESPDLDRIFARVLASPALDELIAKVLDSPSTDRIVAQILASPGLERLIVQVMKSRLVDDLTDRVLASDELQRVVTHVAQSPAIRSAIAESSAGLAGEVADQVRTRTVVADATVERAARRLLRRKPIIRVDPPDPPSPAGAPAA